MKLFTIGFTKKPAEVFFDRLHRSGAVRLVDIRLNNTSQLAGFAKQEDLRYFTREICRLDYVHMPELAPTADILDPWKKRKGGDWELYRRQFLELMRERRIEQTIPRELLDNACLLCSEPTPDHCHRRLVAEYLHDKWGAIEIEHLI